MVATTGKDTSLIYVWEDNFDQAPGGMIDRSKFVDTTDDDTGDAASTVEFYKQTFGSGVTMGTNEGSNNAERQFRPGSRQAEYILESQFDGSWSVDFTLTNPWFLKSMYGDPTTSGGEMDGGSAVTWEHEYSGQFPDSMQLVEQIEYQDSSGNSIYDHRILTGCIVSSMDVETDTEGVVEVSLDGAYANEYYQEDVVNKSDSERYYNQFTQPTTDHRPLHFGNTKMYFDQTPDSGSDTKITQRRMQDASLSLEGNVDMIYELGSRKAADFSPKAIEPELSYTRIVSEDASSTSAQDLKDMYGDTTKTRSERESPADPTMGTSDLEIQMEIDNARTPSEDSDVNRLTFVMEGSLVDSYSRNNVGDPESELEADVDRLITRTYVVAENETEIPKSENPTTYDSST